MSDDQERKSDGGEEQQEQQQEEDRAVIGRDEADEVIDLDDSGAPAEDGGDEQEDEQPLDPEDLPPALAEAIDVLNNDDSVQGFFAHTDAVYAVALGGRGGELALSGGGDDKAHVWSTLTGESLHAASGPLSFSESVAAGEFSADGTMVALGAMDGEVRVYQVRPEFKLLHQLNPPSDRPDDEEAAVVWLRWHPRGAVLAAGLGSGVTYMWNAATGKAMQVFGGHLGPVQCGAFSADGRLLFTGGDDGTLFVWDPKTGEARHHLRGGAFHRGPVTCLAAHPDPAQPLLLVGSADHTASLVHTATGRVLWTLRGHEEAVEGVGFCHQQPWCATSSVDGQVVVWDARNGNKRHTFTHADAVTQLSWHPREPLLFTASLDKTVCLWDARSSDLVRTWKGHQAGVLTMAVSDDGLRIVTGSDDGNALVFSNAPKAPAPAAAAAAPSAPASHPKA